MKQIIYSALLSMLWAPGTPMSFSCTCSFVCARLGDSGQRLGTESETEEEETRLIPTTSQLSLHHLLAE